jgi:hypothetical protein
MQHILLQMYLTKRSKCRKTAYKYGACHGEQLDIDTIDKLYHEILR